MNHKQFVRSLIKAIKLRPGYGSNSNHITTHCPNCETHRDESKHGHLYINIAKQDLPYDCKKCSLTSTKMNYKFLMSLGIQDQELLGFANSNFKIKHSHIVSVDERNKKLDFKVVEKTYVKDQVKLDYLERRMGYKYDDEMIKTYRIITNLSQFLKRNGIKPETLPEETRRVIPILDNHYVGYLSHFGNIINFRYIENGEKGKKYPRYKKITISKQVQRAYIYIPSTPIDPLASDPIINIAEGEMDINAIHMNDMKFSDRFNQIYAASSSVSAFRRAIMDCLSITGFYGATINLYLDNNDKVTKISDYDFEPIIRVLRDFGQDFKVYAFINLAGKDFGINQKEETVKIAKVNLTNKL